MRDMTRWQSRSRLCGSSHEALPASGIHNLPLAELIQHKMFVTYLLRILSIVAASPNGRCSAFCSVTSLNPGMHASIQHIRLLMSKLFKHPPGAWRGVDAIAVVYDDGIGMRDAKRTHLPGKRFGVRKRIR